MGIKNIAKNRAPIAVEPVAIAFPTAATSMRHIICIDLSLVLAELKVTQIEMRKVANYS